MIEAFFQFTASYEADQAAGIILLALTVFQFTASYEADLRQYLPAEHQPYLSIHSLIRG